MKTVFDIAFSDFERSGGLKAELKKSEAHFRPYKKMKLSIHDTYSFAGPPSKLTAERLSIKEMEAVKKRLINLKSGYYMIASYPSWDVAYSFMWQLLVAKKRELKKDKRVVKVIHVRELINFMTKIDSNIKPGTQEDWETKKLRTLYSDIVWVIGVSEDYLLDWIQRRVMEFITSGIPKICVLTVKARLPLHFSYEFSRRAHLINLGKGDLEELKKHYLIKYLGEIYRTRNPKTY